MMYLIILPDRIEMKTFDNSNYFHSFAKVRVIECPENSNIR